MRLNRSIKRPFVDRMEAACAANSLRFYVSDAHFKERCANGSCCGLPPSWNYTRHQYTEALLVAKTAGQVSFSEIYDGCDYLGADFQNFVHTGGPEQRAKFSGMSGLDYARFQWNAVNSARSPYKYFGGVLVPHGRDAKGDVVYLYAQADKPTR